MAKEPEVINGGTLVRREIPADSSRKHSTNEAFRFSPLVQTCRRTVRIARGIAQDLARAPHSCEKGNEPLTRVQVHRKTNMTNEDGVKPKCIVYPVTYESHAMLGFCKADGCPGHSRMTYPLSANVTENEPAERSLTRTEISSLGGKAAHAKGTAHTFTPEEQRENAAKGGAAPHAVRGQEARKENTLPGEPTPDLTIVQRRIIRDATRRMSLAAADAGHITYRGTAKEILAKLDDLDLLVQTTRDAIEQAQGADALLDHIRKKGGGA